MNFGPRGAFSGPISAANSPAGRFRNMYQQSPPANMSPAPRGGHHKERPVTFMPNDQIKIPKAPKQPDKPLPAYMRYSRKVWEKVKAANPEMKMWDIGKLIGEQWRNLPEDERQGFFAEYEVEKSEYQEAMKAYHNSTAYREWLKAKEKAQQAIQEQQMMEKMIGQQIPKEEPRFQLQQVEDEDEDAEFAAKHIASARYQRNHRLITEIFSEAAVPDAKSIVTRPRLENLKRQVQSLMQHQRKLESEIEEMEEKFGAKRKKIVDNSQNFKNKMEELSKPPPPLPEPMETEEDEKKEEEEKENIETKENKEGREKEEAVEDKDEAETKTEEPATKEENTTETAKKTDEKEEQEESTKDEEIKSSPSHPPSSTTSPTSTSTAPVGENSSTTNDEKEKEETAAVDKDVVSPVLSPVVPSTNVDNNEDKTIPTAPEDNKTDEEKEKDEGEKKQTTTTDEKKEEAAPTS